MHMVEILAAVNKFKVKKQCDNKLKVEMYLTLINSFLRVEKCLLC